MREFLTRIAATPPPGGPFGQRATPIHAILHLRIRILMVCSGFAAGRF
jgi:hypothetical protein